MFGFIVILFSSMLLYGCQVANLAKEIVLIPVAVTDGFLGTDIHRDIDSKIATLVNTNNQTSIKDSHQSRDEAPEPIKLAYAETSKSDANKTLISHYVVNNGRITWSRGLINKGFKVAEGHIARRNDIKENNLGDALKYCSNLKDGHYISCIHNEVSDIDRLSVFEIADRLFYVKLSEDKQKISTEDPILLTYPSLQKNEFETTEQFNRRSQDEKDRIDALNASARRHSELEKSSISTKIDEYERDMQKKNDIYVELIQLAMHLKYGYPSLNSVSYNADKQIFEGELRSHSGGFNEHIEIPVDLKYAEKFKPFLIEKASNPSIDFRVIHDKLVFAGVSGLESPSLIVEKDALGHAHSSEELRAFINEYPDSSLVAEAKDRISINEKRYKEGLEKSKLAQQQDEIDKNRKASSYAAQKQIGDKVCLDYSGLFGGGVIKGFVEGKNGNKIQVRITDGYSLHSDYETGRIIWSGYDSWRYCSY